MMEYELKLQEIRKINEEKMRKDQEKQDKRERELQKKRKEAEEQKKLAELEKKKKLEAIIVILDSHLATNQYFAGNQFTLADISYLPYTENLIRAGHSDLLLSKTHFAAWWKKCSERPSWKLCKTEQEVDF